MRGSTGITATTGAVNPEICYPTTLMLTSNISTLTLTGPTATLTLTGRSSTLAVENDQTTLSLTIC